MSPGEAGEGVQKGGPDVLWARKEREKRRGGEWEEGKEEEDAWSAQRMLCASLSTADGCCSVLARQRENEKVGVERKTRRKKKKIKNRK